MAAGLPSSTGFEDEQLRGRYDSGGNVSGVLLSRTTLVEAARIPALSAGPRGQAMRIPVVDSGPLGTKQITLEATVYRPDGDGAWPVVIFNHGSTGGNPAVIKVTQKAARQARFFTRHGLAVVAPMRRGRGASDGDYGETYGCDPALLTSGLARAVEDYPRYGHDVANYPDLWETTADAYLAGLGLTPAR